MTRAGVARTRALLVLAALAGLSLPRSWGGDYEVGKQFWKDAEYRGAYTHLWRYREETLYGRTAQVDYMLGTSGCRLQDLRSWGGEVLDWILRRYPLPEASRQVVQQELLLCRSSEPPGAVALASVEAMENLIGATARASGKTFYWLGKDEQINSYPARRVREIPREELAARLTPRSERSRAVEATQARAPGFTVRGYDAFVLATRAGQTPEVLDRIARHLERYLAFLEREYAVELPPYFVTVYLVPTPEDLGKLADRLHGLRIGRATFGYSFRDDLSVLAAVPRDIAAVGTVMHELLHLAVRSRFGDIPQWLDEGLASLYEVSRFEADRVVGIPNWRGRVLSELRHRRPGLKQLVTTDWFAFERPEEARRFQEDEYGETPTAEKMAATLATARYFTLYLQEQGRLRSVYQALRDQRPGAQPGMDANAAAVAVLERELGKDLDQVDPVFFAWFEQVERKHRPR